MSTSDNSTYVGDDTPDWQKGDITAELLADIGKKPLSLTEKEPYDAR